MAETSAARVGAAAAARLAATGTVSIEQGLTEDEFSRVEQMLGFEFADDHRAFLAAGLPIGVSWPNWRREGRRSLQKRLQLPVDGILFDVEWSSFWHDDWGPRPVRMPDALRSARYHLARVPQLVPVVSHRYLPAGRATTTRPVLSITRTDVAAAGADLAEYVDIEFGREERRSAGVLPAVEFWSDLIS